MRGHPREADGLAVLGLSNLYTSSTQRQRLVLLFRTRRHSVLVRIRTLCARGARPCPEAPRGVQRVKEPKAAVVQEAVIAFSQAQIALKLSPRVLPPPERPLTSQQVGLILEVQRGRPARVPQTPRLPRKMKAGASESFGEHQMPRPPRLPGHSQRHRAQREHESSPPRGSRQPALLGLLDAWQCPRAAATSEKAIEMQAPEEDAKVRRGRAGLGPQGRACGLVEGVGAAGNLEQLETHAHQGSGKVLCSV